MTFIKEFIKKNKALYSIAKKITNKIRSVRNKIREDLKNLYLYMLPIKKNKIVFSNFLGNSYGDNPKYICEEILRQKLNYELVWILKNVNEPVPEGVRVVEFGSFKAQMELSTAKVWVLNIRYFPHPKKKKRQVYLQTWHGNILGFKLIEGETDNLSEWYVSQAKYDGNICNAIISADSLDSNTMKNHFWLNDRIELLEIGVPKNDNFYKVDYIIKMDTTIRSHFNIPKDVLIVLYMPTSRDEFNLDCYNIDYERVIRTFEKKYHKKFIMLIRFHPNLIFMHDQISIPKSEYIIDASNYPDGNNLMCAADYLISDYSSVISIFALLKKSVFIYAPDYDEYCNKRGVREIYKKIPASVALTNDQLINNILAEDDLSQKNAWKQFFNTYKIFDDGHASERAVEWIVSKTKKKKNFDL